MIIQSLQTGYREEILSMSIKAYLIAWKHNFSMLPLAFLWMVWYLEIIKKLYLHKHKWELGRTDTPHQFHLCTATQAPKHWVTNYLSVLTAKSMYLIRYKNLIHSQNRFALKCVDTFLEGKPYHLSQLLILSAWLPLYLPGG